MLLYGIFEQDQSLVAIRYRHDFSEVPTPSIAENALEHRGLDIFYAKDLLKFWIAGRIHTT